MAQLDGTLQVSDEASKTTEKNIGCMPNRPHYSLIKSVYLCFFYTRCIAAYGEYYVQYGGMHDGLE